MKKIIICLFVLASITINAQNDNSSYPVKGDFTISPQIGLNLSTFVVDEGSFNNRTSFALGVTGNYHFSEAWSLRSGLLLDNMGAEDSFGNTDKLSYLTIPINASWHFGGNRNWYLNFGLTNAILVGAKGELSDGSEVEIKDFIESYDLGLNIGIGYRFDITPDFQLGIDYQGYGGMIPILNVNDAQDLRNSRSQFNIITVFKL
ncbi:MAG: outer membrane beta-barrel protein [Nonlabens sp.]